MMQRKKITVKRLLLVSIVCLSLIIAFLYALVAGEYPITVPQTIDVLLYKLFGIVSESMTRIQEIIIWKERLPRLFVAMLSGIALACSGVAYQGCFRNPLVEPYLLGVSSGAAFGASLSIVLPHIFPQGQLMAFIFALLAVALACVLAKGKQNTPPIALVLAGVVIGALFAAFVSIMKYIATDTGLREITFWMMGGFYYSSWNDVKLLAITIIPSVIILTLLGWKLNILALSDEETRSLGIHPSRTRLVFIVIATLIAAMCVSTVGIIAWVGLMMPHAARMLVGADNRWVFPAAALMGALYLLCCDTLARTLTGAEIPIGIIASIVGAPYLLWLLRTKGKDIYA